MDTCGHLILLLFEFLISDCVKLFGLGKIEFQLGRFTLTFNAHVLFPVVNTFIEPLLHESSVSLKFVYLNAAHLLLTLGILIVVISVKFV